MCVESLVEKFSNIDDNIWIVGFIKILLLTVEFLILYASKDVVSNAWWPVSTRKNALQLFRCQHLFFHRSSEHENQSQNSINASRLPDQCYIGR